MQLCYKSLFAAHNDLLANIKSWSQSEIDDVHILNGYKETNNPLVEERNSSISMELKPHIPSIETKDSMNKLSTFLHTEKVIPFFK
jgi:hypothetical protein